MSQPEPHSIIVWSSDWTETTGQAIVTRRVVECQLDINWIDASYGRGGLQSMLGLFRAVGRTFHSLAKRKAQTIYLVCSRSGIGFLRDIPALAASLIGARVVVHVHGSDIIDLLSCSPFSLLARKLYDGCEILVPSEHLIAPLQKQCSGKIRLCENFVPLPSVETFATIPMEPGPLVVWNSNIMASKGFFDVAEAVRLARTELPNLRFVALGRPLRDIEMNVKTVKAALAALCEEEWFTYLGVVSPETAFIWTAKADVVVFPSRYRSECQPLAVVQAMCLARPLVLSDTPALRATAGNYPGIFLPNPSLVDLSRSIIDTIRGGPDPDLVNAADAAQRRFAPERFDRSMSSILKDPKSYLSTGQETDVKCN
jgi:glycosyltransferase involved in cell wall biosynthesis